MYNKTLENNFLTLCIDISITSERFKFVMKSESDNNCIFYLVELLEQRERVSVCPVFIF